MCEFIAFSCQFGIKLKSWGKNPMDYEAASLMNKQAVIDYSFPSSGSFLMLSLWSLLMTIIAASAAFFLIY